MEGVHAVIRTEKKRSFLDRLGRDMRRYWRVYVMLLPVVAFYLVFKYGSMGFRISSRPRAFWAASGWAWTTL